MKRYLQRRARQQVLNALETVPAFLRTAKVADITGERLLGLGEPAADVVGGRTIILPLPGGIPHPFQGFQRESSFHR